jgi:hypothetical protein
MVVYLSLEGVWHEPTLVKGTHMRVSFVTTPQSIVVQHVTQVCLVVIYILL